MSLSNNATKSEYVTYSNSINRTIPRALREYLHLHDDSLDRIDKLIELFVGKIFDVDTFCDNSVFDELFKLEPITEENQTVQYVYDTRFKFVNYPIKQHNIPNNFTIATNSNNYPKHYTPLFEHRALSTPRSRSDTDESGSELNLESPNNDVLSDCIPVISTPSRNNKFKLCQLAQLNKVDTTLRESFISSTTKTDSISCGILIYVDFNRDVRHLALLFDGYDLSNIRMSAGGSGIVTHIMNYGSDVYFTNEFTTFKQINALYKISITKPSDVPTENILMEEVSDLVCHVDKFTTTRLLSAISLALNKYIGHDFTFGIIHKNKHTKYTLAALVPITRLRHWKQVKIYSNYCN